MQIRVNSAIKLEIIDWPLAQKQVSRVPWIGWKGQVLDYGQEWVVSKGK